ncbi:hypothetical protein BDQ94DRAFT_145150 [Aspergillus welwitschiae]|uniref:NAD(P)-binding domain-containing protein n=1 Tax=Aspergillus welwitschiae TaxID=1341132 RepID=A0A3F3Q113_9EURO|nr:hypothetical protein BDQ94DRAFT_145150 [Aspergillus welwitschiae]RDH32850.1 hypothetical protein BDQ94DRAFT_145150 [Aspergillus welwitschiae]
MRALVIGGTGRCGRLVIDELLRRGRLLLCYTTSDTLMNMANIPKATTRSLP